GTSPTTSNPTWSVSNIFLGVTVLTKALPNALALSQSLGVCKCHSVSLKFYNIDEYIHRHFSACAVYSYMFHYKSPFSLYIFAIPPYKHVKM
ncbi:hypothetical protein, partial [Lysinibacillus mangiferihumi]|uniref:hypothetical protein n=1 Tax=Lysinibacillus mangiferihumi TaxID=1130819 RepID=UPI001B868571